MGWKVKNGKMVFKRDVLGWVLGAVLLAILFVGATLIVLDWKAQEVVSLREQVILLEEQMRDKLRPEIYIQRATVYNAKGEIGIQTIEEDE